jgi:hypothetical protein
MSFNLPEEYEKYSSLVDNIIEDYIRMIEEDLAEFDGGDIMPLLALIGNTLDELRSTVEELKEIDDVDRIPLYFTLVGIVIEKSITNTKTVDESQKEQIRAAFGENGLFQTVVNFFNRFVQKKLNEMDTNKDKKVTKEEYTNYLYKKNMKYCGCAGKAQNLKSAQCATACCFPILSGGDDIIDLIGDPIDEDDLEPAEN